MGNDHDGVHIDLGAQSNRVGSDGDGVADAAERNIISANGLDGVRMHAFGTSHNVVAGNYIGTNATGTKGLGNVGGSSRSRANLASEGEGPGAPASPGSRTPATSLVKRSQAASS